LTGDTAWRVAGSSDTIWVYSFYSVPKGSSFEVVGGVSEYRSLGNWTTYDKGDGLVSEVVKDLALDGDSLWVATVNGVSRLDGEGDWLTLKAEDGLASNEVLCVAVGPDEVWFGTNNGTSVYDKGSGAMETYRMEDGLLFNYVVDIAIDGEKRYFATSQGVGVYNSGSGEWSSITKSDGLAANGVNSILVALDSVWFATGAGVSRLHGADGSWDLYTADNGLPDNAVSATASDGHSVWFVTKKGVAQFKPEKDRWKVYTKGLPLGHIYDIASGLGYIWLGTNQGLARLGMKIPINLILIALAALAIGSVAYIKIGPVLKRKAERASTKRPKPKGPPPWRICEGSPSRDLCPLCRYSSLKGGEPYCTRYNKRIEYQHRRPG
jgi:ligand-binding sensor domain-containing protein